MASDDKIRAYANARLSQDERDAFESEMAGDASLRAEVAALTAAQKVFANDTHDMPKHGWARLSDRIDAQDPRAANDNRPFRFSLLQAACIAVTAILGWELVGSTLLSNEPATYTTASAEVAGPALQVVFSSDAAVSGITEVLADLNGSIVDGPSALGLYVVAFPDDATRDAAFDALGQRSDIVSEVLKD